MEETILKATSMEDAINGTFTEGTPTPEAEVENKFVTEEVKEEVKEEIKEEIEEEVKEEVETELKEEIKEEEITNVEIKTVEEEVKTEPIIQEKIVEKPIEFKDEHSQKLFEAITSGNELEVLNYLKSKHTDYNTMPTLDVLREKIKADKPHWDNEDIESHIEATYGDKNLEKIDLSLIDEVQEPNDYKQAEAFNKEVDRLLKLRERDAKDARVYLESQKPNIELPSVKREEAPVEPQLSQEEIEADRQRWVSQVEAEMESFSDIKLKVGNEEITYKFTDEDKAKQIDYMKKVDTPTLFKDLGWIKEDGTDNIKKIAEDVQKLKDFNKIISSIGTQMKTSAKKEVVAKDIKNIDLNAKTTVVDSPKRDVGDYILSL